MGRRFSPTVEIAVRTLREICAAPQQSIPLRARAAELILSAYGLTSLPAESESRHLQLKKVKTAVELSSLDKQIARRMRQTDEQKLKRIGREIRKLAECPHRRKETYDELDRDRRMDHPA
jgi:hypothetical protein